MDSIMEQIDEILYIRLPRELDHHVTKQLCREVDARIRQEKIQMILFDFADTEFCDSSGIGMLMGRYRLLRALGGEVQILHAGPEIRRVLALSGVTRLFPRIDDREE